jgi:hypothetical protein
MRASRYLGWSAIFAVAGIIMTAAGSAADPSSQRVPSCQGLQLEDPAGDTKIWTSTQSYEDQVPYRNDALDIKRFFARYLPAEPPERPEDLVAFDLQVVDLQGPLEPTRAYSYEVYLALDGWDQDHPEKGNMAWLYATKHGSLEDWQLWFHRDDRNTNYPKVKGDAVLGPDGMVEWLVPARYFENQSLIAFDSAAGVSDGAATGDDDEHPWGAGAKVGTMLDGATSEGWFASNVKAGRSDEPFRPSADFVLPPPPCDGTIVNGGGQGGGGVGGPAPGGNTGPNAPAGNTKPSAPGDASARPFSAMVKGPKVRGLPRRGRSLRIPVVFSEPVGSARAVLSGRDGRAVSGSYKGTKELRTTANVNLRMRKQLRPGRYSLSLWGTAQGGPVKTSVELRLR